MKRTDGLLIEEYRAKGWEMETRAHLGAGYYVRLRTWSHIKGERWTCKPINALTTDGVAKLARLLKEGPPHA